MVDRFDEELEMEIDGERLVWLHEASHVTPLEASA